jgi:hypothetical protein
MSNPSVLDFSADEEAPRLRGDGEHLLATVEATWDEAVSLCLERGATSEEAYHTISSLALSDDAGATSGLT